MHLSDFDLIFLKKNPPVDRDYKILIEKLFEEKTPTVNDSEGIQIMGSKAYLKYFSKIIPNTFFANGVQEALGYIRKIGNCVIKQSDSYGGKGVDHIHFKFGKFHGYKGKKEIVI